jgi:CubicO group peptidase (beta-lactamase class C family)
MFTPTTRRLGKAIARLATLILSFVSKLAVATVARPLGFARDWRWSGIEKPGGLAINPRSGERSYSVVRQRLLPFFLLIPSTLHAAEFPKWSRVELEFTGPQSKGRGTPNPFAIRFDCRFTSPAGEQFRVPGFYDGNGQGELDGATWRVRFSADREGTWTYATDSNDPLLDGQTGELSVTPVAPDARGYWKSGRLEYTGTADNGIRYLKFRDGSYWLKAGCDDPENFLGRYRNFDTLAKRKTAVDYLASHGINSLYIMTHNIDGDDKDVWPWLGETAEVAKTHGARQARFDLMKLEEWRQLFEHMQTVGVVPYLILEDDSAWKEYDHDRYYREMIARFGYLPALVFNLGEEHNENYEFQQGLELARDFKAVDPYGHPLGIHNINRASDEYVNSPLLDFTSIQTGQPGRRSSVKYAVEHNQIAVDWIKKCESNSRRVLNVNFDEGRPELDRVAWWSAYLGGGVWEAHVMEPYDQPFSAWETTWKELSGTRRFMESVPFHTMQPRNDLVRSGHAFCLAELGESYVLYLPEGGQVSLELAAGDYRCAWWDPAQGQDGEFRNAGSVTGGVQTFVAPGANDWALRIARDGGPVADQSYFPPEDSRGGWRQPGSNDVAHVGRVDKQQLDTAFEYIQRGTKNGGLLVLHDGWLVYEKYFGLGHRDATPNLASCGKSFTSIAVGMLIAERPDLFPDGLDQKIFTPRHFPPAAFPLTDPRKADIRLGQLLTFSAGIRGNNPAYVNGEPRTIKPVGPDGWQGLVDEITLGRRDGSHRDEPFTTSTLWCDPGGGYSYATASIHMASIMVRHISGMEMEEYLADQLARPLGWGRWGFAYKQATAVKHTPGGGGIALRATDMLRFGYLLLNEGHWGERQLVPAEYVRHCSQHSRFNPHFPYSLQFTVNSTGHFEGLPRDAFWKAGSGGHALYVVPSLKLVVWKLGGRDSQYSTGNTGLPPSPASREAVAQRADWKQTVEHEMAWTETLRLVVEAVERR